MKVLVTGGAGYIGSHMTKRLLADGHHVVVVDDLSRGHRDAVNGATLIEADIRDQSRLEQIFSENPIDLVMHFASRIEVGESVVRPELYFDSIVLGSLSLARAMLESGVRKLVFSSSAAVYGEPSTDVLVEDHPRRPTNPYGRAKLMVEEILGDLHHAHGLDSVSLRYFNAAGAAPDGSLGERHDPETHLIPLILQAASGKRSSIKVFGTDYDTPDGSCVRDFVHVDDLGAAHLLAAARLESASGCEAFNLGNGTGFSVRETINAVKSVTGRDFDVIDSARRAGDPAVLVADASLAFRELGWSPHYTSLETIIEHAWNWETR